MISIKINLALSGGGIKGISHLGGLEALLETGIEIDQIAGSSAGAIVAALYGAGYEIEELKEVIFSKDFTNFKERFCPIRLIKSFGFFTGKNFLAWIEAALDKKEVKYFKDLNLDTSIITAEVNSKEKRIFSVTKTPQIKVAKAVRMSIGIPIFYIPYLFAGDYYVDGGVINNFPLRVFKDSDRPTVGFMITELEDKSKKLNNLIQYLSNLVKMMIAVNEEYQINTSKAYIAQIKTPDYINAIDFSISKQNRELLYRIGYDTVKRMIRNEIYAFLKKYYK